MTDHTFDDVILDLYNATRKRLEGRPYKVTVHTTGRGIELTAEHRDEEDLRGTAVLNRGEVLEFPDRIETAAGDLVAYLDALEGNPNADRLGRIPNGRIPEFDEAPRTIKAPGRRLGRMEEW